MLKLKERARSSTYPVIDEDLWLDDVDVADIAAVVSGMVGQVRGGNRPIKPTVRLVLRGAQVSAGTPGSPRPRDIRASSHFSAFGSSITLAPFPLWDEDIGPLVDDTDEFETAILGILAHEVSHVRQHEAGARTRALHLASEAASQKVQRTNAYDDYIAYLCTPLEMAAHATQLAVEMRHVHGPQLRADQFRRHVRASWLWKYMRDQPKCVQRSPKAARRAFGRVSPRLLSNAWWSYQRLGNRIPAWPDRMLGWVIAHLP